MLCFQDSRDSTLQTKRSSTKCGSKSLEIGLSVGSFGHSHCVQRREEAGSRRGGREA